MNVLDLFRRYRFEDPLEEQTYLDSVWTRTHIQAKVISIVTFIHTFLLTWLIFVSGTWTPTVIVILGLLFLFTALFPILAFVGPFKTRVRRNIWFTTLTIVSLLLAFSVIYRDLACGLGFEVAGACSAERRPVAPTILLYAIVGPFLMLVVLQNNRNFQLVACVLFVIVYIVDLILLTTPSLTEFIVVAYLLGAFVVTFLAYITIDKSQRSEFQAKLALEREIVEKNKAQVREKLAEQQRIMFTNYIFHEIRNPLNYITLSFNLLQDSNLTLNREQQDWLMKIATGLSQIENILNDTLDYSKLNEGKLTIHTAPFDLLQMINNLVWAMSSSWVVKNITFTLDINFTIDYLVIGDELRTRQVLQNYLSNAVKFTPSGGNITLKLRKTPEECIPGEVISVYFEVEDNGIGIKEDDQRKLFQPFVQINPEASQQGKGTGLGLSIAANIVRLMDGHYGVRSVFGAGSSFWFQVYFKVSNEPVKVDSPATVTNTVDVATGKFPFSLNILVADDEPITRTIMGSILRKRGYQVEFAEDGQVAFDKVMTNPEYYDLLFIDNQMPQKTGLQVVRDLRNAGITIPIIAITGTTTVEEQSEFINAGANYVLLKPSTAESIEKVIRMMPIKQRTNGQNTGQSTE